MRTRTTLGLLCIFATCLVCTNSRAAERVKFGSPKSTVEIQTQPLPSKENDIPQAGKNIGNVNAVLAPQVLPSRNSAVIRTQSEDEDQENWIFHDTRSAKGIQRALGVELYETETTEKDKRTPTTVIEEYFDRQSNSDGSQVAPNGLNAIDGLDSSLGDFGTVGFGNVFSSGSERGDVIQSIGIGRSGFQKTLNSPNPSIRSYYRTLYKDQLSPGQTVVPALDAVNPLNQQGDQTRTRQLYNRAAMIEAMAPKTPASVFENQQANLQAPAVTPRENRQEKQLIERRGGKFVVPSRPF